MRRLNIAQRQTAFHGFSYPKQTNLRCNAPTNFQSPIGGSRAHAPASATDATPCWPNTPGYGEKNANATRRGGQAPRDRADKCDRAAQDDVRPPRPRRKRPAWFGGKLAALKVRPCWKRMVRPIGRPSQGYSRAAAFSVALASLGQVFVVDRCYPASQRRTHQRSSQGFGAWSSFGSYAGTGQEHRHMPRHGSAVAVGSVGSKTAGRQTLPLWTAFPADIILYPLRGAINRHCPLET
jgi:hypothetical protein